MLLSWSCNTSKQPSKLSRAFMTAWPARAAAAAGGLQSRIQDCCIVPTRAHSPSTAMHSVVLGLGMSHIACSHTCTVLGMTSCSTSCVVNSTGVTTPSGKQSTQGAQKLAELLLLLALSCWLRLACRACSSLRAMSAAQCISRSSKVCWYGCDTSRGAALAVLNAASKLLACCSECRKQLCVPGDQGLIDC